MSWFGNCRISKVLINNEQNDLMSMSHCMYHCMMGVSSVLKDLISVLRQIYIIIDVKHLEEPLGCFNQYLCPSVPYWKTGSLTASMAGHGDVCLECLPV